MAISTSSGAKFFIGPVNSTADIESEFEALTYTEVGEVESVSEFGDQASTVTAQTLADARVRKRKGTRDAGDITVVCLHDPLDAGQLALVAAEKTYFTYAIKVELADAADANDTDTVFYFLALIASTRLSGLQPNEITKRNFVALIDSAILELPSEVVP